MSERKVLNKYYPPDFDPSKIPKLREPKNKVFSIRIMAPFNMRCNVCGEYIYKGKKFNSRKENVDDDDFLGLRIFRFYIRCPKCVAEIAFKTDLKNTDYTLEAGATRLFEAEKLAQQMAEQERLEKEAEELNPMKVLENRTKASHKEMAQIDELEELREINARHAKVDTDLFLEKQRLYEEHLLKLQQEEEDQMILSIFGKQSQPIKRLADSESEEDCEERPSKAKKPALTPGQAPTDLLVDTTVQKAAASQSTTKPKKTESWQKSVGTFSSKGSLASLVKKKTASKTEEPKPSMASSKGEDNAKPGTSSLQQPTVNGGHCTQVAASSASQTKGSAKSVPSNLPDNTLQALGSAGKLGSSSLANGTTVLSSALGLLGGYSDSEGDSE